MITKELLLAILRLLYMLAHELYEKDSSLWTTEYRDQIAVDLVTLEEEIERQEK